MNPDDQFFADFAKELQQLVSKYFHKDTKIAVALAPPPDYEVRYIMNRPKPAGIALFEQAADLARKEMNMPAKVVNPEKIAEFAKEILKENPKVPLTESAIISLIVQELEKISDISIALTNVKKTLNSCYNF